jgi:hypothetical protein
MNDHRPQRGDSGPSRHEQEVAFLRIQREDERADRPLDRQAGSAPEAGQQRTAPVLIELQQELQAAVGARLFRGGCDGVRYALLGVQRPDQGGLTGTKRKPGALQGQPNPPGRRRGAADADDGKDERLQNPDRNSKAFGAVARRPLTLSECW